MNEELKKLREIIAASQKKIVTLKADMGESKESEMMEEMSQMMNYCMNYVFKVEDAMYSMMSRHNTGHIPTIKGAGKMQSVLETLGLADDYEVIKPNIFVGSTKRGMVCEASYEKKKE